MIKAKKILTGTIAEFNEEAWKGIEKCNVTIDGKEYSHYGWVELAKEPAEAKPKADKKEAKPKADKKVLETIEKGFGSLTAEELIAFVEYNGLQIEDYKSLKTSELFEKVVAAYKSL